MMREKWMTLVRWLTGISLLGLMLVPLFTGAPGEMTGVAAYDDAAMGGAPLPDDPPPLESEALLEDAEFPTPESLTPQVSAPEAQMTERELAIRAGWAALEAARQEGPEAVVALLDTLRGPALDAALDEIQEAQERLAASTPPPPETAPVSDAEEQAALEAQRQIDAANRAQALADPTDPAEGQAAPRISRHIHAPTAPTTRTVGAGCTYTTVVAAIAAANLGDTLLIEGGRIFTENLTIPISLTLQGGYDGCASGSTNRTTIDGNAGGPVVTIPPTITVSLQNLNLTNGNTGMEGGGIRFARGAGTGTLNLTNVHIHNNIGHWGGGLWVGPDAEVTGSNVQIYDNTASSYGGGVRLYGSRITLENSNIYNNTAPRGAGVYATQENGHSPVLNLPTSADLYDNQALTDDGFGGGLYMRQGEVSLAGASDLYSNDAIQGGGAYLVTATLTIHGASSEINYNTATGHGGGIYAQGSSIDLDEDAEIEYNEAGTGGSGNGGGAYLDDSGLYSDKASINNNTAQSHGGGVYAVNGSNFDMDLGGYTCLGPRCSRLYSNVATSSYGGGLYLNDSTAWLDNTFVEGNQATRGGGIYVYNGTLYLNNSLVARNDASLVDASDGVRLYTGATMTGEGNTFAYNESGGGSTGQAIGIFTGATLSLRNSIVWGHTTSIDDAGQTVTCSDIEGGYAGAGNLNVDPQFVASGGADYHLQSTSPVIDQCATGLYPDFDNELRPIVRSNPATPYDMGADEFSAPRVGINGGGCAYGTIQQAINAGDDGDMLQIAADTYSENVVISGKSLTLEGGYDSACATPGSGVTTMDGSYHTSSVVGIVDGELTLRALEITGGDTFAGGGVDAGSGARVTLSNTLVYGNAASYGGGVYVGTTSVVTLTNGSNVRNNTATTHGGGARVWGRLVSLDTLSDINDNTAPHGGGVSVAGGVLHFIEADMSGNQATDPVGRGGAIYVEDSGVVTMTGNVWIYNDNQAYDGAGVYADASQVSLGTATIGGNTASHWGGGVYLTNDSALFASGAKVGNDDPSYGNEALIGAGIYAQNSRVEFEGNIYNNRAEEQGGGVYAESSTVRLTNAHVGGTDDDQANDITGGVFGAGLYFSDTHALLSDTVVASNTFSSGAGWGGGMVSWEGSVVTLTEGSRIENHYAPNAGWGGAGAGLLVYSSTVTLDNSQVLSNTADIYGAGIYMLEASVLNVLDGSHIAHNHALNGPGGGIVAVGAPDINISDATLRDNTAATDGGAIYIDAGTLDFTGGWTLSSNEASGNGGAVAVLGTADTDFDAGSYSLIYNNSAGINGGVIYVENTDTVQMRAISGSQVYVYANQAGESGGVLYSDSGATFDLYGQVNLDRNWASNGPGGAVYLGGGGKLWLDDFVTVAPELWDNRAYNNHGGAVYAADGSTVECDGAIFGREGDGNLAFSGSGGALYLSGSTLYADNCIFQENQAVDHGGAIAAYTSTVNIHATYPAPAMTMQSSRVERGPNAPLATGCDPTASLCSAFFGNVADSDADDAGAGGALYANESSTHIAHTYFYSNTAVRGGAIHQIGSNALADVANSLIYSNTATANFGSGIRSEGGAFTVTHVTLANNVNGAGYSQSNTEGYAENSIAWGNENGGFWITSGPLTGICNIDQSNNVGSATDPHFADAAHGDFHLLGDSPAIDVCVDGLSPDLDNTPRPVGADYDMGAYEYAYGLAFAPDNESRGSSPGGVVYTHTLTNTGGVADTFTLTTQSSNGWSVTLEPASSIALSAGQTVPITASLSIPEGVVSGTVDTLIITATSGADPDLTASVTDTTHTFLRRYPLTTTVVGDGAVARAPSQTTYLHGSVVTLTATPDAGWHFDQWSGDASGSLTETVVTMTSAKVVTATFLCEEVTGVTLTQLTTGDIYTTTVVQFRADIAPDTAIPYTYTVDFGAGPNAPVSTVDNPLLFNHTFPTTGTKTITFAAWSCEMTVPFTDTAQLTVVAQEPPERHIYLPLVMRNF